MKTIETLTIIEMIKNDCERKKAFDFRLFVLFFVSFFFVALILGTIGTEIFPETKNVFVGFTGTIMFIFALFLVIRRYVLEHARKEEEKEKRLNVIQEYAEQGKEFAELVRHELFLDLFNPRKLDRDPVKGEGIATPSSGQ